MEPVSHSMLSENNPSTSFRCDRTWLESITQEIYDFSKLHENWNSYGAAAISPMAISHAVELCKIFYESNVLKPYVFPTPSGGIQLEWHKAKVEVEMEILPDGSLETLCEHNGSVDEINFPDIPNMLSDRCVQVCLLALNDAER